MGFENVHILTAAADFEKVVILTAVSMAAVVCLRAYVSERLRLQHQQHEQQ